MKQISDLESAKRWSAERLFDERIHRQVRRSGRMSLIVNLAVPEAPGAQVTIMSASINFVKNYHHPTALNVRFVAPNRAKPLFNAARDFRFADGGAFDFAGQKSKTIHNRGRTLAQSNQRAWKGFGPTFFFRRTYFHFVGSYKLDSFFVKPTPEAPRFAPYYGRTLQDLNTALETRISDHCPIAVDIPLEILK